MAAKKNRFLLFLLICLIIVLVVLGVQNRKTIMTKATQFDFSTLYLGFPALQRMDTRVYAAGTGNYLFFTRANQLGMVSLKNRAAWKVLWTVIPENAIIQDITIADNIITADCRKITGQDENGFFLQYTVKGKEAARYNKTTRIPHITVKIMPAGGKNILVAGYEYPGTYKSGLYTGLYTQQGKVLKEAVLPATANLVLEQVLLTAEGEWILVCLEKGLFSAVSTVAIIKLDRECNVLFNQDTTRELDEVSGVTEEAAHVLVITGSRRSGAAQTGTVLTFDFSRKDWYLY